MNKSLKEELQEIEALRSAYLARFRDTEEGSLVMHPQLLELEYCRKLVPLMREAMERGTPLTEEEIDRKIGPISWYW